MKPVKRRLILYGAAFCIVLAALLLPVGVGAGMMIGFMMLECTDLNPAISAARETVSFPSAEFNRETPAVLLRGDNSTSTSPLVIAVNYADARELSPYLEAGALVLLYTSRSCVGGVPHALGLAEARQMGDALAFVRGRTDLANRTVIAHGYSAGGAAALMAAAQFPDIDAVVAQGGYEDFSARLSEDIRPLQVIAPLFEFGVRAAYRIAQGESIDALSPISAIPAIVPRPVLLIYGTAEPSIGGARSMAALGTDAVWLVEISGATHGSYQTTDPEAYRAAVLALLDKLAGT